MSFFYKMRLAVTASATALIAISASAGADTIRVGGFSRPMAVKYDGVGDRYLVTNAPQSGDKPRPAFISLLSPDGRITKLKWIADGKAGAHLVSPKGLAISGDELFVADVKTIRVFDLASGKAKNEIALPDAHNVVDLTIMSDGAIIAVDPGADLNSGAVFRIVGGQVSTLAKGPQLWRPTSVAQAADGRLLIGPSIGGTIFVLGMDGVVTGYGQIPAQRLQPTVVRSSERIGGIVPLEGDIVLGSTWESGRVGRIVLGLKPKLDWDAERRITLMRNAKTPAEGDGLQTPAVQKILQQSNGPNFRRGRGSGKDRPPIAWPEAKAADFVATGLTTPNKFAMDRKRGVLVIPELAADRVSIVSIDGAKVTAVANGGGATARQN